MGFPSAQNYRRQAFRLRRHSDVTGVSGTGDIAEGAHFSDGSAVLCWKPQPERGVDKSSIALWPDIPNLLGIHGHDGKTEIVWQVLARHQLSLETFALMESELGMLLEGVRFSNGTVVTTRPNPYPRPLDSGQLPGLVTVWPSIEAVIDDAGARRQTVMLTWDRL